MPVHTFKCENCGEKAELYHSLKEMREVELCSACFQTMRKTFEDFGQSGGGIRVFKPHLTEHLGPQPVFVKSKKQLAELSKKHGVYSHYVEDSYNRRF